MAMITAAIQTQVTTSIINRPQPAPVIIVGLLVPCLHLHLVPPPLPAGLLFILMVVVQRMVDLVPELVLEFIGDLEIQSRFAKYLRLCKSLVILFHSTHRRMTEKTLIYNIDFAALPLFFIQKHQ